MSGGADRGETARAGALVGAGTGGDAVVHVHVQPRSGRTAVAGVHGDALRIRVTEPPAGGRATEAARRALAAALDLPAARVELAGGAHSRAKRFRLAGVPPADAVARVARLLGGADGA